MRWTKQGQHRFTGLLVVAILSVCSSCSANLLFESTCKTNWAIPLCTTLLGKAAPRYLLVISHCDIVLKAVLKVVSALIEAGANPALLNNDKATAYDLSRTKNPQCGRYVTIPPWRSNVWTSSML